jgi:putative alpha-1,2-mannosidase
MVLKCSALLLIALAAVTGGACDAAGQESAASRVNPMIGTGGHGHTYPGASVPFGMIQPGPDAGKSGWDWCSGYHYSDTALAGFSHTHLSGTGCGDLGDLLVLPGRSSRIAADRYRSPFSHGEEEASPGYYAVRLRDSGIRIELTATARAAMHRYTFPPGDSAFVAIKLGHGQDDITTAAYCALQGNSVLAGYRFSNGWAARQRLYFAIRFSHHLCSVSYFDEGSLIPSVREASGLTALLRFSLPPGDTLLLKVGISGVSAEGALANLDSEIRGWDFDAVRREAGRAWEDALGKIAVQGSEEVRTVFATAFYHAMLAPTLFGDADRRYRGADDSVHVATGFNNYSTFSLWDTFRAAHPLYTVVDPARAGEMVCAMLAFARESGFLPVWPLAGNETNTMIGYHAVPVIADAILKGIGGFDVREAYQAMKRSALRRHRGLEYYIPSLAHFAGATGGTAPAVAPLVRNGYQRALSGDTIAYHSALPSVSEALIVRADGAARTIAWESARAETHGEECSFAWLAGMASGKGAHRFFLSVNGMPCAAFTSAPDSSRTEWEVTGEHGARLAFRASFTDWFGDLFGTMVVTLPAQFVLSGKPQTFRITADSAGSPDWFMTFLHPFAPGMTLANEYGSDGGMQVIRLDLQHLGPPFCAMIRAGEEPPVSAVVRPGVTTVWLKVPPVASDTPLRVRVDREGRTLHEGTLLVRPVRPVGYVPADKEPESVSKTLEYAYDDWCIARVARFLGYAADDSLFTARSLYYRNLYDPSTGFMRGRNLDGSWRSPFDPRFSTQKQPEYTEGNAWQYTWFVPHDVDGLIALMGGRDAFLAKLDSLFSQNPDLAGTGAPADVSGLIGLYAHGNEPSHHIAYLYALAGEPWKTQKLVRRIMRTLYAPSPDGLCGNEDCGQMSAWYVLSALGFYPVNPAGGEYVIGSPAVEGAVINLGGGRTFVIRTKNMSEANVYVQSVTLNGVSLQKHILRHEEIMAGGTLEFTMGPSPFISR